MTFDPTRFYRLVKDAKTVDEVRRILEPMDLSSDKENRIVQMYKTSQMVREREQRMALTA